jgi:ribosomal-protein-alanine N-acetyltransferase
LSYHNARIADTSTPCIRPSRTWANDLGQAADRYDDPPDVLTSRPVTSSLLAAPVLDSHSVYGTILTGESIRLQPVVLEEAEEWLAGDDEEAVRGFEAPGPATLSNVVRAINEWQSSWEVLGGVRQWGIRPRESDALLGGVDLRKLDNGEVNLSYLVFPRHRRQGIAVEASRLAIDYAKREMGATRVIVKMLPEDEASLAVARQLGAKPIGTGPSDAGGTVLINVIELT